MKHDTIVTRFQRFCGPCFRPLNYSIMMRYNLSKVDTVRNEKVANESIEGITKRDERRLSIFVNVMSLPQL